MRVFLIVISMAGLLVMNTGCEGDYEGRPGDPGVEVNGTPDLDPRTDHDVDVKTPDVNVDVHRQPGQLPKVDVDVGQTPDTDTNADNP